VTLLDHPEWPLLRPYVVVKPTERQQLEVTRPDDMALLQTFLKLTTVCVACDEVYLPVHPRKLSTKDDLRPHPVGGMFLRCCCPKRRCSRTKAARTEKALLVVALDAWKRWRCP